MRSNALKGAWFGHRVGDHLRTLGHDIDPEHEVEIWCQWCAEEGREVQKSGPGLLHLGSCTMHAHGATMRLRKIVELRNTRFGRLSVSMQ